jgi:superfamily II DNA or RNA helicase
MGGDLVAAACAGLWPHQREAVELSVKHLGGAGDRVEERRAQLRMACGLGKTRVGGVVAQLLAPHGRVLLLAPTVMLLTQTLAQFRAAAGSQGIGRVLVVCSRQQVGEGGRAAREDLEAQRVPVSTDPAVIAAVGAGAGSGGGRVTVLATYASLGALVRAHDEHRLGAWDLVIADEAHRTAGAADRPWARLHHQDQLPARRRLYMTATPRLVGAGGETAGSAGLDLVGMDDERVFGPVAYQLGFSAGIELGLLARWRLVVAVVTDADIRAVTAMDGQAGATMVQLGQAAVSARMLAVQIALLRTAAELGLRRAISYHSRVADARAFAATLPDAAALLPATQRPRRLWAGDVHGAHTAAQRDIRMARLADGVGDGLCVLANARLLSEGVDVPAVDTVLFANPRASTIDVVQAIGRALRRGGDPDKIATIIVPLLTGPDDDTDTAMSASAYAPVWRVVRALRAHDDAVAAELDHQRRHRGRNGQRAWEEQVWVPGWLQIRGDHVPEGFSHAIAVRVVQEATSSWQEHYGAAVAYHAQHGDLHIRQDYRASDGLNLGEWITGQRRKRARGRLTAERIAQLDALGMIWNTDQAAWEQAIARAAAFAAEHGHLDIPASHTADDGFRLGMWLNNQRCARRDGTLPTDRHSQLEVLGVDWNPRDTQWRRGLAAARAYRSKHGHLDVPQLHVEGDLHLGSWINGQRSKYRQGKLPESRIAALTKLGITWEPIESRWERGLKAARAYRSEHGHLKVPAEYQTPDGFKLGSWIQSKRASHRDGTLPADHVDALERIDMQWNTRDVGFQRGLAAARAYHAEYGHLRVPGEHRTSDGFPLGRWLSDLRNRPSRVTPQRQEQLAALDPNWNKETQKTRSDGKQD